MTATTTSARSRPQGLEVLKWRAEQHRAIVVGGSDGRGGWVSGVGEEPAEVAVEVGRRGRDERSHAAVERGEGHRQDTMGRCTEEERGGVRVWGSSGVGGEGFCEEEMVEMERTRL